ASHRRRRVLEEGTSLHALPLIRREENRPVDADFDPQSRLCWHQRVPLSILRTGFGPVVFPDLPSIQRKIDGDYRPAVAWVSAARYRNLPTIPFNKLFRYPKPNSCAKIPFRCEERFKYLAEVITLYAMPRVAHRDVKSIPPALRLWSNRDRQLAALWHCIK